MSIDLDGVNDEVNWAIPSTITLGASQDWTLACWFNLTAGSFDFQEIFAFIDAGANEHVGIALDGSENLKIISNGKTPGNGSAISVSTWYQAALTWNGTQLEIFLNGTSDYSVTPSSAITWASLDRIAIGERGDGSYDFDGFLAEMGLWDVVLDAAQISALADGFSPSCMANNLLFYAPGLNSNDDVYGEIGTTGGDPGFGEHPRVIRPSAQIIQFPPGAAPTSNPTTTVIPRYYRQLMAQGGLTS